MTTLENLKESFFKGCRDIGWGEEQEVSMPVEPLLERKRGNYRLCMYKHKDGKRTISLYHHYIAILTYAYSPTHDIGIRITSSSDVKAVNWGLQALCGTELKVSMGILTHPNCLPCYLKRVGYEEEVYLYQSISKKPEIRHLKNYKKFSIGAEKEITSSPSVDVISNSIGGGYAIGIVSAYKMKEFVDAVTK